MVKDYQRKEKNKGGLPIQEKVGKCHLEEQAIPDRYTEFYDHKSRGRSRSTVVSNKFK